MHRVVTSVARVVAGIWLAGCAAQLFPSTEEGVTVERAFVGDGEKTEVFLFKPAGQGPFPGMVLIHGAQPDLTGRLRGREFFMDGTGELLAAEGYAVLAPSMPGFGRSSGEPDFRGSRTIERLRAAVSDFQNQPYVEPERLLLFGASRGAAAAALLSQTVPGVKGLVLQSGVYDLTEAPPETRNFAFSLTGSRRVPRKRVGQETGRDHRDMMLRASVFFTHQYACPILFIHGVEDQVVPIDQMQLFVDRVRKALGPRREIVAREVPSGHVISGALIWSEALPFLKRCLLDSSVAQNDSAAKRKDLATK